MKDFEELVMQQDFTLVKKQSLRPQLPALGAQVQVEKVIVQDETVVKENEKLQAELKRVKT